MRLQGTLPASLSALEQDMLIDALKSSRGNVDRAAGLLGISRRHMQMSMP
jgi:transcriptional regulator of acetoin/glycerol metabolism